MSLCNICPRSCNIDRSMSVGYCGEGDEIRISKVMLHKWEEPCISVGPGSGAVFFSGCSMHCVYCQNSKISGGGAGEIYTEDELSSLFLRLQEEGAANINLVTPTHFTLEISKALEKVKSELEIPVVWNTSSYEKPEAINLLGGLVDIFLADFKYADSAIARRYSNASDYPEVATTAIEKMVEVAGRPRFDGEKMTGGVIVRHLVLPRCYRDSIRVLNLLSQHISVKDVLLSLMSQYTPEFLAEGYPEINRRITTFEYEKVQEEALRLGFEGFGQSKQSATSQYTPQF